MKLFTTIFFASCFALAQTSELCQKRIKDDIEKELAYYLTAEKADYSKVTAQLKPFPISFSGGEALQISLQPQSKVEPQTISSAIDEADSLSGGKDQRSTTTILDPLTTSSHLTSKLKGTAADPGISAIFPERFFLNKSKLSMKSVTLSGKSMHVVKRKIVSDKETEVLQDYTQIKTPEIKLYFLYENGKLIGYKKRSYTTSTTTRVNKNGKITIDSSEDGLTDEVKEWKTSKTLLQFENDGTNCNLLSDSLENQPTVDHKVCEDYFSAVPPSKKSLIAYSDEKDSESCTVKSESRFYGSYHGHYYMIPKSFWEKSINQNSLNKIKMIAEKVSAGKFYPQIENFSEEILTYCGQKIANPGQIQYGPTLSFLNNTCAPYKDFYLKNLTPTKKTLPVKNSGGGQN